MSGMAVRHSSDSLIVRVVESAREVQAFNGPAGRLPRFP